MEFNILPKSVDSLPKEFQKEKWTLEDCEEYVRKREQSKDNKLIPLHQLMRGAKLDISEIKQVWFKV